jgi:hypothetical protein
VKRRVPTFTISIVVSLAIGFLCGFFAGYKYASKNIVCELPAGFFQPRDAGGRGTSPDLTPEP